MLTYLEKNVIPEVQRITQNCLHVVIAFNDLHSSHYSDEIIKLYQENNIEPCWIPSHSSHVTQAHDLVQFPKFKSCGYADIDDIGCHFRKYGIELELKDFAFVLERAYMESHTHELNVKSAKEAGVVPRLNPYIVAQIVDKDAQTYEEWLENKTAPSTANTTTTTPTTTISSQSPPREFATSQSPPMELEKQQQSAADWWMTCWEPQDYRSHDTFHPDNRRRLLQNPKQLNISVDMTADPFDFHGARAKEKLVGAALNYQMVQSGLKQRSRKVGGAGDVVTIGDIHDRRSKLEEEQNLRKRKRQTKKPRRKKWRWKKSSNNKT